MSGDLFKNFSDTMINDHSDQSSVSRIVSESNLTDALGNFLVEYYSETEIDNEQLFSYVTFENAVRKAEEVEGNEQQLAVFISKFRPRLFDTVSFSQRGRRKIAVPLEKYISNWGEEDFSKKENYLRAFPTRFTEALYKTFWFNSPSEFCSFLVTGIDSNNYFHVYILDLLRLYNDEPFQALLDGVTENNLLTNDFVYGVVWERWLHLHVEFNARKNSDPGVIYLDAPQIKTKSNFVFYADLSEKWHNRLLQLGFVSEAKEWEKLVKEDLLDYYDLGDEVLPHLEQLSWQRLCYSEARQNKEDKEDWLYLAFKFKKSFCHKDCSVEFIDQFIDVSLELCSWPPNEPSDWFVPLLGDMPLESQSKSFSRNFKYELSDSLPLYWYASDHKERWLIRLEEYLLQSNPQLQIKVLKYLFNYSRWHLVSYKDWDDYEVLVDRYGQSEVEPEPDRLEDHDLKAWIGILFSIGNSFLNKKIRLETQELFDWLELAYKNREKADIDQKELVPFADKLLAFWRPYFYQKPEHERFELQTCETVCRILFKYAPDKMLKNLLATFRKCPTSCSNENLEYGADKDIKAHCEFTSEWWISILISNCLRLPYAWPYANQPSGFKDIHGAQYDYKSKEIYEDGYYRDENGNSIDRHGQIVDKSISASVTALLRKTFAEYCLKSIQLKRKQKLEKGSDRFYKEEQCFESNPYWREAFIHALSNIGLDLNGSVHKTLKFVSTHDPSENVRKTAAEAYKSLRRQHHHNETDPVKGLLIAFWILRLGQRKAKGESVDPQEATKIRRKELKNATYVNNLVRLISK